jgi:hypothetical protein
MSDHDARIEEAVTFLRESESADRSTVIELLKEDGYSGNEIMEALGRLSAGEAA